MMWFEKHKRTVVLCEGLSNNGVKLFPTRMMTETTTPTVLKIPNTRVYLFLLFNAKSTYTWSYTHYNFWQKPFIELCWTVRFLSPAYFRIKCQNHLKWNQTMNNVGIVLEWILTNKIFLGGFHMLLHTMFKCTYFFFHWVIHRQTYL